MPRHLRVTGATLLALAATMTTTFLVPAPAGAFTLGVGDRADGDPSAAQALGARLYRVVIDADVPLAAYDARIFRFRAAGLEPQLVIGGTGTARHANRAGLVAVAVAAARRWPFAYSVSVVNEPDISGMSVCGYARTYGAAYRALKAAGVRRVLFGEFSPGAPLTWTRAILTRCNVRLTVDRFAWHCYDLVGSWEGRIANTPAIRDQLAAWRHKIGGHTPRLYCSEYGVIFHWGAGPTAENEVTAMRKWRAALRVARRYLSEMVAWDVHTSPGWWDSSLIEPNGRRRPAFNLIRQSVGSRP